MASQANEAHQELQVPLELEVALALLALKVEK